MGLGSDIGSDTVTVALSLVAVAVAVVAMITRRRQGGHRDIRPPWPSAKFRAWRMGSRRCSEPPSGVRRLQTRTDPEIPLQQFHGARHANRRVVPLHLRDREEERLQWRLHAPRTDADLANVGAMIVIKITKLSSGRYLVLCGGIGVRSKRQRSQSCPGPRART